MQPTLRGRRSFLITPLLAAALALSGLGVGGTRTGRQHLGPLRTLVAGLTVATEVRTGYDRALFPLWIDADGDGCNTRYEVLIAEATTAPTMGSGCTLTGGRWYSYYDNAYWTAQADLGDSRPLVAGADNVNQSKGDQDPAEWMPSYSSANATITVTYAY